MLPLHKAYDKEVFELLYEEYLEGGITDDERNKVEMILRDLREDSVKLEMTEIRPYLTADFTNQLDEAILDCESILNHDVRVHSKRFVNLILPQVIKSKLPLPQKFEERFRARGEKTKGITTELRRN